MDTDAAAFIHAAVSPGWQARYGEVVAAWGPVVYHPTGDALAGALAGDWTAELVILDLALASPGLVARLGPMGPRLLAFGDPDYAGVALGARLVEFVAAAPDDDVLTAALRTVTAPGPWHGVADRADDALTRGLQGERALRIAEALARGVVAGPPPPPIDPGRVRGLIRARRARDRFFPPDLFGEPGWDMLLDLALASAGGRDVAVSSLCIAAAVPTTTALRWIRSLSEGGVFERHDDPLDARRAFIRLSPAAVLAMAHYLAQLPGD